VITMKTFIRFFILGLLFVPHVMRGQSGSLVDPKATKETKALYRNLKKLSKKHTLFGHQHATEYGHGWEGDADRSDVKSVTGSHPAVIGIDFSPFTASNAEQVKKYKEHLLKVVEDTYNRGGVITAAWHFLNPVSPGGFYWVDSVSKPAVKYLIPGGSAHEQYKQVLKGIAGWANSVRGADGKVIPMIFRPFHELDGDWFWWGKAHCTPEEMKSLWRFTVEYLRDSLGVHNFIYAFSTDNKFLSEGQYLERYPGDKWIDMVGIDNYGDMGRDGHYDLPAAIKKLEIINDYAEKHQKLAAFTETGLESIPNPTWWTGTLLKVMRAEKFHLAYVLVWRNDLSSPTHFYAPFPGQVSVPDFLEFYNDPCTLFEKDLKKIYK
jgi:mannan endo-1,4-beta-mannosidase